MSDSVNTHKECEFTSGAPLFLAGLATLSLILAAVIAGKSLWFILLVWVLGGPLVFLSLSIALALDEVLSNAKGGASRDALGFAAGGEHV